MWPRTDFKNLLGIEHPIVQAPMAGSATVGLAAAVSNAGGLGSMGCGEMTAAELHQTVEQLRKATDKPFNLNFMVHPEPEFNRDTDQNTWERVKPFYDSAKITRRPSSSSAPFSAFNKDVLEAMLELRPPVVSFHFGLPHPDSLQQIKTAGCLTMSSATTVAEARQLNSAGVDVIIAQGWEAGGHRGSFETNYEDEGIGSMALIPQVADAVDVPVVSAGGIADGRGIAAAFALGASGVQMGSAFLLCPEASISDAHREALRNAKDSDTRLTRAYSGRPARAKNNAYVQSMAQQRGDFPGYPSMYNLSMPIHQQTSNDELKFLLYGQAAALNREKDAGKLVQLLVDETFEILFNPA